MICNSARMLAWTRAVQLASPVVIATVSNRAKPLRLDINQSKHVWWVKTVGSEAEFTLRGEKFQQNQLSVETSRLRVWMAARVGQNGARSGCARLTALIHDWRSIIVYLSRTLHMLNILWRESSFKRCFTLSGSLFTADQRRLDAAKRNWTHKHQ